MAQIKDYRIVIELCEEEFELSMGRKPKDQQEFDEWAYRLGHIVRVHV
jgi:hypothetical protein